MKAKPKTYTQKQMDKAIQDITQHEQLHAIQAVNVTLREATERANLDAQQAAHEYSELQNKYVDVLETMHEMAKRQLKW